jgi:hypothetical protein
VDDAWVSSQAEGLHTGGFKELEAETPTGRAAQPPARRSPRYVPPTVTVLVNGRTPRYKPGSLPEA